MIKWISLGVVAYLVFLVATLPAQHVINRINLPNNVSVEGVSGTIWQGKTATLVVNNIAVNNVRWDISALSLLMGNLTVDLDAGNIRASDEVAFNGPLTLNLFNQQHIQASDFSAYVPANMVLGQIKLPIYVDAAGRFKVMIETLNLDNACLELNGQGQWLNASIEGIKQIGGTLDLGNFNAQLSCIDNDILVTILEPNVFNLSAKARVPLHGKPSIKGRFKPSDDLPKQVKDAAVFFRNRDSDGYRIIDL